MSLSLSNPVFAENFPDPFVIRSGDGYYAYATDLEDSGENRFPILRSANLRDWNFVGKGLSSKNRPKARDFWAPEVAFRHGRYFMYYAADYQLRVAVSQYPEGPFEDTGRPLTPPGLFAIDAHPFQDPKSRKWFLYYVIEMLDASFARPGVGIVCSKLADSMVEIAANPIHLLPPSADWQTYETNRSLHGRVWPRWHTVEGPFVIYRNGSYFLFYSGGNYKNESYGVSVAVGSSPLGPFKDHGTTSGSCVLATIPESLLGPGHNSIVEGPEGHDYIVYHALNISGSRRQLCVDRLQWRDGLPFCQPSSFRL